MMIEPPTAITQHDRDGACRQENQDQGIGKETQEGEQGGEARLCCEAVRAVQAQSLFRLCGGQPRWSCFEHAQQLSQWNVPETLQRLLWFFHWQPLPPFDLGCTVGVKYRLSGRSPSRAV